MSATTAAAAYSLTLAMQNSTKTAEKCTENCADPLWLALPFIIVAGFAIIVFAYELSRCL